PPGIRVWGVRGVGVERAGRERVEPVGDRDAVEDVENAVIDSANMYQPIVFSRHAWRRRDQLLKLASAIDSRRAPDEIRGQRRRRTRRLGTDQIIQRRDDDLFAGPGHTQADG